MDKKPEIVVEKKPSDAKALAGNEDELMHDFAAETTSSSKFPMKAIAILLVAAVLGVGTGYVFASQGASGSLLGKTGLTGSSSVEKGKTYGSDDLETFKDTTEGKLQEGGIEGEGQYHLVRPGGESQNVYLTSSLVDLSEFVGREVKVWGQTQQAQRAGWLMDVGRVEVVK